MTGLSQFALRALCGLASPIIFQSSLEQSSNKVAANLPPIQQVYSESRNA